MTERIPLARPDVGAREEELVLEVLRSGRLSLGPMLDRFEQAFGDWLGAGDAVAVSSGTAALHLAVRARAWRPATRSSPALQLRRIGQLPALRGRAAGLLRHRPAHAQHRSGGRRERRLRSAPPACCRSTSSATRPTCRRSRRSPGARGLGIVEDACEALGAVDADGTDGRRARQPGRVRLLRQQAARPPGRAGWCARARRPVRSDARAQPGPRRRHGLARPRPARLQLPAVRRRGALGVAQVERLDELLAERARVAASTRERLGGSRGPRAALRGRRRRAAQLVRLRGAAAAGVDRDARDRRCASAASRRRRTCRRSTSSRSTASGSASAGASSRWARTWRARSLALPFFTAMGEAEVERVADAVRAVATESRRLTFHNVQSRPAAERLLWSLDGLRSCALAAPGGALAPSLIVAMGRRLRAELGCLVTGGAGFALIALGLVLLRARGRSRSAATPTAACTRAGAARSRAGGSASTCSGIALRPASCGSRRRPS